MTHFGMNWLSGHLNLLNRMRERPLGLILRALGFSQILTDKEVGGEVDGEGLFGASPLERPIIRRVG